MIICECKNIEARDPIVVLRNTYPFKASDINAADITYYFMIS